MNYRSLLGKENASQHSRANHSLSNCLCSCSVNCALFKIERAAFSPIYAPLLVVLTMPVYPAEDLNSAGSRAACFLPCPALSLAPNTQHQWVLRFLNGPLPNEAGSPPFTARSSLTLGPTFEAIEAVRHGVRAQP